MASRRNSVAVYYYTLDRPVTPDFGGPQVVEWRSVTRDDFDQARASVREWLTPKVLARKLTPPIVWDSLRWIRSQRGAVPDGTNGTRVNGHGAARPREKQLRS